MRKISLLTIIAALSVSAMAVQISVNTTAQTTSYGYTEGQSYTFTYDLGESFSGDTMTGDLIGVGLDSNAWFDNSNSSLYTSVSSSALSGNGQLNGDQTLVTTGSNYLTIITDCSGFTMLDGTAIQAIDTGENLLWELNNVSFETMTPNADPATYFAKYSGTYAVTASKMRLNVVGDQLNNMFFDITSVVITPEPATMAILGLGGLFVRRRKA